MSGERVAAVLAQAGAVDTLPEVHLARRVVELEDELVGLREDLLTQRIAARAQERALARELRTVTDERDAALRDLETVRDEGGRRLDEARAAFDGAHSMPVRMGGA